MMKLYFIIHPISIRAIYSDEGDLHLLSAFVSATSSELLEIIM